MIDDLTEYVQSKPKTSEMRSPSIQKRLLEHEIKVEDRRYENTWRSGCMVVDRRAVTYFTQISILLTIMGFSLIQLVRLDSCEGKDYFGLLTMMIGILLPNPKFDDTVTN